MEKKYVFFPNFYGSFCFSKKNEDNSKTSEYLFPLKIIEKTTPFKKKEYFLFRNRHIMTRYKILYHLPGYYL